jgi:hypothetical protein
VCVRERESERQRWRWRLQLLSHLWVMDGGLTPCKKLPTNVARTSKNLSPVVTNTGPNWLSERANDVPLRTTNRSKQDI